MLRLKQLRAEGFRGFSANNSGIVEFSTPAVLIYGDNHQGKSSLLNAIEWCLYGEQCIGTKSGIRERVGGWEIVNRNASEATVELMVETDHGVITIIRSEARGKGERGKRIEVTLPDGSTRKGKEAEQEIAGLIGLSFRDFATTVYQHQETIRDIVIQTPKDRNDAIDRLLGLSDYRNILEGVKKSKIADIEKELPRQRDLLAARIEQALSLRQSDLEQKRKEAVTAGLDVDELTQNKLLEGARGVGEQIAGFASELGIPAKSLSYPSEWKRFPLFSDEAKGELERLWSESPDVKEQSQLNQRRTKADSLKAEYSRYNQELSAAKNDLNGFEQQHGDQHQIDEKIQETQKSINAVDEEISRVSPKAKLVEEGIAILEKAAPGESTDLCPLCGEKVQNLLRHLKEKWSGEIESQVQALKAQLGELQIGTTRLQRLKTEHAKLTEEIARAENQLMDSTQKIAGFLERELTNQDDPVEVTPKNWTLFKRFLVRFGEAVAVQHAIAPQTRLG